LDQYLPQCEKTYSATEVGKMLGLSSTKVGMIANRHGLKTPEYGMFVLDKSRYSAKEVETFRYNALGVERIRELVQGVDSNGEMEEPHDDH